MHVQNHSSITVCVQFYILFTLLNVNVCRRGGSTRTFVWYYVTCLGEFFIAKLAFCFVFTLHVLCKICFFYCIWGEIASHENVFIRKVNKSPGCLLLLLKWQLALENKITWYTFHAWLHVDFFLLTAHFRVNIKDKKILSLVSIDHLVLITSMCTRQ